MSGLFTPIIEEMNRRGEDISVPQPFQEYLRNQGILKRNTAQYISVDVLKKLAPELRDNQLMVFRLGSHNRGNTQFGLARWKCSEKDSSAYYN